MRRTIRPISDRLFAIAFPLLTVAAFAALNRATAHADPADDPPKSIAPFFQSPKAFAGDFGAYRSPLLFDDGTKAKTAEDWKRRRKEILQTWNDAMGPWPALIAKPKIEYLAKERRGNVTQHHVRIEVISGRPTDDAYLLVPDGPGPFPAVVVVFYDAKTGVGQGKGPFRDYAWQLAQRGFVTLSLGSNPETYYPSKEKPQLQALSLHAYEAANCWQLLASLPFVDSARIGIVGHSYGGKWAMFAACLFERFAAGAWSDPGIVFDETRSNVNYWDPWYLGLEPGKERKRGLPTKANPAIGPYKKLVEAGRDLHELHALMAPRPFWVSGGAEDPPERWKALHHAVAVNDLLGVRNRVAMTTRPKHEPTAEANEQLYTFFEWALGNRNEERPKRQGNQGETSR